MGYLLETACTSGGTVRRLAQSVRLGSRVASTWSGQRCDLVYSARVQAAWSTRRPLSPTFSDCFCCFRLDDRRTFSGCSSDCSLWLLCGRLVHLLRSPEGGRGLPDARASTGRSIGHSIFRRNRAAVIIIYGRPDAVSRRPPEADASSVFMIFIFPPRFSSTDGCFMCFHRDGWPTCLDAILDALAYTRKPLSVR